MEVSTNQPEQKSISPTSDSEQGLKTQGKGSGEAKAASLVPCSTCGSFFEKRPSTAILGVFHKMLPDLCPKCLEKAEADYEADRLAQEEDRRKELAELAIRRKREQKIRYLGGEENFEDHTFERYETEPPEVTDDKHRATFRKWKETMERFDVLKKNLYVYGPVGTGKSHILNAKAHWMLDQGGTARVMDKMEFIAAIRGSKSYQPEAELLENLQQYTDIDVLVIHDIEDEPNGAKANTIIKMLIELRSRRRKGGLLFSSNKPPKSAIEYVGKKNVDRMDGKFLLFEIPEDTPSMRGVLKRRKK